MARVIGYVKSFEQGTFFVKDAKGEVHKLKAGDAIHQGELVYGAPNNPKEAKIIIDVTLQGAGDLVIAGNGALVFDTSLLKGVFSHDDAVVYINSVNEALAVAKAPLSPEKTEAGDETAAGDVVTDSERMNDTFAERDGTIRDVNTALAIETAQASEVTPPTDSFRPVDLNNAPTAAGAEISVDEESQNTSLGLSAPTDVDGNSLNITVTGLPSIGVVTLSDGTVVTNGMTLSSSDLEGLQYDAPAELSETTTTGFTYSVDDGEGESNSITNGSVSITVNPVNDAPVAINDSISSVSEIGMSLEDTHSITSAGNDSVGYTYFTVLENNTTITITTNGPTSDPVLYLLRDDGMLSSDDYITYNDDGGSAAGSWNNSLITITLDAGQYVAIVSDYSFDLSEAVSGLNDNNMIGNIGISFNSDKNIVLINQNGVVFENDVVTIDVLDNDFDVDSSAFTINSFDMKASLVGVTDAYGNPIQVGTVSNIANQLVFSPGSDFDYLAVGQNQDIVFTYDIVDDTGAVSNRAKVAITITGTNDTPVAQAAVNAVDEDATITGSVAATDADAGETATLTYDLVNSAPTGLTFNSDGSYSFDASSYDYLKVGEPLVLTIAYTATDVNSATSTPANLVITITGTNDKPTFSVGAGNDEGAVTEDSGVYSASGTLVVTDPDAGQSGINTAIAVIASLGALGSLTINAQGEWTYSVDNADIQYLSKDEPKVETFTVTAIDGTTHTIEITITGVNDAPVANDDIILTNIAAGQNITIASKILMANDTDVDHLDTLAIASSSNAVNGTVSGTDTVVFKDTASFGATAQIVAEASLYSGDSEANPLNNTIANAYEIGRGQFGQVSATDGSFVTDTTLPSFKWTGRIDDGTTSGVSDKDFLKVYLYAGEKIILDIDGADSGSKNIGGNDTYVDMYLKLYDANGAMIADNDDAAPGLGGAGSVKSGYHSNSLDSYLTYTATTSGYYYVEATAWNNNASGIQDDDGDYQLWISIDPTEAVYPSSFDYSVTDQTTNDSAHVTVQTVQGSAITGTNANEILMGGTGSDTLDGGAGNDTLIYDPSDTLVDGGLGLDTLIIQSSTAIDFTTLASNPVKNMEVIDLTQTGVNGNITISLEEVVAMTDANNTLTILGDASDTVNIPSATGDYSVSTDSTSEAGFDIYTYTSTNASDPTVVLKIDSDIQQ